MHALVGQTLSGRDPGPVGALADAAAAHLRVDPPWTLFEQNKTYLPQGMLQKPERALCA
jgi:hypothetical protein